MFAWVRRLGVGVERVWAGWHVHLRITFSDGFEKFCDKIRIKNVFCEVGVTVDVGCRDVCMKDQVGFPESVVLCNLPGSGCPAFGQPPTVVGLGE